MLKYPKNHLKKHTYPLYDALPIRALNSGSDRILV